MPPNLTLSGSPSQNRPGRHALIAPDGSQHAQARTVLQRQIDATGRQIDKLVYELYELTEEEIRIVEEGAP